MRFGPGRYSGTTCSIARQKRFSPAVTPSSQAPMFQLVSMSSATRTSYLTHRCSLSVIEDMRSLAQRDSESTDGVVPACTNGPAAVGILSGGVYLCSSSASWWHWQSIHLREAQTSSSIHSRRPSVFRDCEDSE